MSSITQQDINVRLQLSGCAFSDLALRFNNDLRYGRKCVTKNRIDLMLLNIYIEMLECYNIDSTSNCLTEDEIQLVIEKISTLTGVCFMPIGFTYTANTLSSMIGLGIIGLTMIG